MLIVNHSRITPNQITFTAIFLRLVTAFSFFTGTRWGLVVGAFTYFLAYVCDCTDGTVARIKKQSSELGRHLDHVADLICDVLILLILAWTQNVLFTPMVLGMFFMHIAESYISYLANFVISFIKQERSSFFPFILFNSYRRWWFNKNIKSTISFPDYAALVFVFFPLLGKPLVGLQIGFYLLLHIVLYTIFSTFVSIYTGERCFP